MDELREKKAILSEALLDIKTKLRDLKKQRQDLESDFEGTLETLDRYKKEDIKLRDYIAKLTAEESKLSIKSEQIKEKISAINEKLAKMRKIRDEMEEIN